MYVKSQQLPSMKRYPVAELRPAVKHPRYEDMPDIVALPTADTYRWEKVDLPSPWDKLPDEMIELLLGWSWTPATHSALTCVCRKWRSIVLSRAFFIDHVPKLGHRVQHCTGLFRVWLKTLSPLVRAVYLAARLCLGQLTTTKVEPLTMMVANPEHPVTQNALSVLLDLDLSRRLSLSRSGYHLSPPLNVTNFTNVIEKTATVSGWFRNWFDHPNEGKTVLVADPIFPPDLTGHPVYPVQVYDALDLLQSDAMKRLMATLTVEAQTRLNQVLFIAIERSKDAKAKAAQQLARLLPGRFLCEYLSHYYVDAADRVDGAYPKAALRRHLKEISRDLDHRCRAEELLIRGRVTSIPYVERRPHLLSQLRGPVDTYSRLIDARRDRERALLALRMNVSVKSLEVAERCGATADEIVRVILDEGWRLSHFIRWLLRIVVERSTRCDRACPQQARSSSPERCDRGEVDLELLLRIVEADANSKSNGMHAMDTAYFAREVIRRGDPEQRHRCLTLLYQITRTKLGTLLSVADYIDVSPLEIFDAVCGVAHNPDLSDSLYANRKTLAYSGVDLPSLLCDTCRARFE